MHTPTLRLEELVTGKQLKHDGNPVMRWMISNVVIDRDPAGNIKPTKGKSAGKIDGVVAAIMAIGASIKGNGLEPDLYEQLGRERYGNNETTTKQNLLPY
jgi:phage terminase large subunit-like protein